MGRCVAMGQQQTCGGYLPDLNALEYWTTACGCAGADALRWCCSSPCLLLHTVHSPLTGLTGGVTQSWDLSERVLCAAGAPHHGLLLEHMHLQTT
jgi:hypothetical protein